jgi:hypothetical protein
MPADPPPAKNPQAHTLLPLPHHCLPPQHAPQGTPAFFPLRKKCTACNDLPQGIPSLPIPGFYAISYFCKRRPNITLWSFLHNFYKSPLHKKLHFRHTPKKAFAIGDFDTTPPRMTLLVAYQGFFGVRGPLWSGEVLPLRQRVQPLCSFICI